MGFANRLDLSQTILDFIYQLPNGYSNYPEHVLRLFSKYLHQNTLAFIPICLRYADLQKARSDYFVGDYLTLNVPPEWLRDYNRYYHSKDIFRHAFLPADLRRKPVVTIEDVMPYDKFRQTEYYLYLQRNGTPHQVVINLNHRDTYLGAIAVYHTVEEGPFTPEEIAVFETLNPFIAQHYCRAIESSPRNFLQSLFREEGFRDLDLGIVMLDEAYLVLEANRTAQRYAEHMLKEGSSALVYKTAQGENSQFPKVQQVFNRMGSSIFCKEKTTQYICGDQIYQFHASSMISPSKNLSKMETLYLVFIHIAQESSVANPEVFKALTAREAEIVERIAKGCSNTQIAQQMHISIHTVKTHILNIYKKQGVNSRTALLHKLHNTQR